jgi:release factor glutamine methyltransferase
VLLAAAARRLQAAGVDAFEADARTLMAHVLAVQPSRLLLLDTVDSASAERFGDLVERRAERVPLQHLTGRAYFRHEQIQVGPGVFVPRPETEVMTGWAVQQLQRWRADGRVPLVVELCAGSGAIARSLAHEVPGAVVHAVEISEEAGRWAALNLSGTTVELHVADMATALHELDGTVDLVVANPPYIPLDAYASVTPEVRDHDPLVALFSGEDGLDALRVVARVAARLLRVGGMVCAEHAEVQVESAPAVFLDAGAFSSVRDHQDLAGRPRFVTAVRAPTQTGVDHYVWQDRPNER